MIPYDVTDDLAAHSWIARLIHNPHAGLWSELYAPERVEQTVRALKEIALGAQTQMTDRRADFLDAQAEYRRGNLPESEWVEVQADYNDWRPRVARYRQSACERLRAAKAAQKRHNLAASKAKNTEEEYVFRDLLAALVETVQRHQDMTDDPSDADRMLWAHVDLGRLPSGHPLTDLTRRRRLEVAT